MKITNGKVYKDGTFTEKELAAANGFFAEQAAEGDDTVLDAAGCYVIPDWWISISTVAQAWTSVTGPWKLCAICRNMNWLTMMTSIHPATRPCLRRNVEDQPRSEAVP